MNKKAQDIVENGGKSGDKPSPAEKPISLYPLKFEEAVKDLLKVKPSRKKAGGDG